MVVVGIVVVGWEGVAIGVARRRSFLRWLGRTVDGFPSSAAQGVLPACIEHLGVEVCRVRWLP